MARHYGTRAFPASEIGASIRFQKHRFVNKGVAKPLDTFINIISHGIRFTLLSVWPLRALIAKRTGRYIRRNSFECRASSCLMIVKKFDESLPSLLFFLAGNWCATNEPDTHVQLSRCRDKVSLNCSKGYSPETKERRSVTICSMYILTYIMKHWRSQRTNKKLNIINKLGLPWSLCSNLTCWLQNTFCMLCSLQRLSIISAKDKLFKRLTMQLVLYIAVMILKEY